MKTKAFTGAKRRRFEPAARTWRTHTDRWWAVPPSALSSPAGLAGPNTSTPVQSTPW